ncbi:MAG: glycoside hydrolase family 20 zincin-like fold domain-containing protein [Candidatus Bathyarchaeia archaeon]
MESDGEFIIFPEPKEVIYKNGEVVVDGEYKIVHSYDADPLEVETALRIAKRIEELTKSHLQVLNQYKVSKKQKIIFVGEYFKHLLSAKLNMNSPEGYVLEIQDGKIIVAGNTPAGTFYAGETLKQLLKLKGGKMVLPKVIVKDWPDYKYRGLYIESKWGPDLMDLNGWKTLIDFMASLKLNFLCIGVYGCWVIQYDNQITEFLFIPLKNYPRLRTLKTITYYSSINESWVKITYLPKIFVEDFFSEIIAYGKKRNVIVCPAFNSLGHNTLIPREYPEISAIEENGNPTNYGFCLTNPNTLKIMFDIYDEIIDKYLKPNNIDFFHIELDEIYPLIGIDPKDPKRVVDPWCKCVECCKKTKEGLFLEYIISIIKHLLGRGINKICVWNDQITRMNLLEKFAERLKEDGLIDKVIIGWWYYGINEKDLETNRFDFGYFGSELGLIRWVVPMGGYYFWWMYQSLLENIYLMLRKGFERGAEGVMAYCTFDYSFHKNYYCLSEFSWNQMKKRDLKQFNEKYAKFIFKDEYEKALKAFLKLEMLSSAGSEANSWLSQLFYYPYSYVHPDKNYPRLYPQEIIDNLKRSDKYLIELNKYHDIAKSASEYFNLINNTRISLPKILDHYKVECMRYQNTIEIFIIILEAFKKYKMAQEVYAQSKEKSMEIINDVINQIEYAIELQKNLILNIEKIKADYLLPQTLRDLSFMLVFLFNFEDKLFEIREKCLSGEFTQLPEVDIRFI